MFWLGKKFHWSYRDGEIEGDLRAKNLDEAWEKLYAKRPDLHRDMFEMGEN